MPVAAPWWGVPVIAGSFLIIGAVLGFLFNLLQDRRKHKREDTLAHRERLVEIITGLVQAHVLLQRMHTGRLGHSIVNDDESEAGLRDLHLRLSQLLLFDAGGALTSAADESVMNAVWLMVGDESRTTDDLQSEYRKSYDVFIETAREHLGIPKAKMSSKTKEASRGPSV